MGCTCTYNSGLGWLSVLWPKKSGLPGRKEGRLVHALLVCVYTSTIAAFVAFTVPSTTPMSNTRHEEVVWMVYIRL